MPPPQQHKKKGERETRKGEREEKHTKRKHRKRHTKRGYSKKERTVVSALQWSGVQRRPHSQNDLLTASLMHNAIAASGRVILQWPPHTIAEQNMGIV